MCSVLLCKSTCGACGKFSFEPNNQEQIAACTFRLQKPHDKQKPASCCCCSEKLTGQAATPSLSNTFSKHKEKGGPPELEKKTEHERERRRRGSEGRAWGGVEEEEESLRTGLKQWERRAVVSIEWGQPECEQRTRRFQPTSTEKVTTFFHHFYFPY